MGANVMPSALRARIWLVSGLFVLCVLPIIGTALLQSYLRYEAAQDDLESLCQLRLAFEVANLLSAERGPVNGLLGTDLQDGTTRNELATSLRTHRRQADQVLDALVGMLADGEQVEHERELILQVRQKLDHARKQVDQVAAKPLNERRQEEVEQVIQAMFTVVDQLHYYNSARINALVAANREAAIPAIQGQVLIELRDYGGRLASSVMAPVAVGGPWQTMQLRQVTLTEGRLLELWRLADGHEAVFRSNAHLSRTWDIARRQFFGESMPLVNQIVEEGRRDGRYSVTAAEFTRRYVPTLRCLEELRAGYLGVSILRFKEARDRSAVWLVMLGVTAAGTLTTLLVALRIAHRQVLKPLLIAQERVIQLARDAPSEERADTHPVAEIQMLFDAIEVLRSKLFERSAITSELRAQAETDSLTGVLNRRALEMVVRQRHKDPTPRRRGVVILLDVDHFKAINDRYGHPVGDEVLVQIARLLQGLVRETDTVARYGGEEFLILLGSEDLLGARYLAESLRQALEEYAIQVPDGTLIRATASFGVAEGDLDALGWRALVRKADTALYQAKEQGRNRVQVAS